MTHSTQPQKKMMISHSRKTIQEAMEFFLKQWDYSIETMDDETNREYMISVVNNLGLKLSDLNNSWTIKCVNYADKLEKLLKNDKYKENESLYSHSIKVIYMIKNLYELKNRRTDEVFKLRAENAELKLEIQKLKQLQNET